MEGQLFELKQSALSALSDAVSSSEIESIRVQYLGKKGLLTDILKGLALVSNEDRPRLGQIANQLKAELSESLQHRGTEIDRQESEARLRREAVDIHLPGVRQSKGRLHPIRQVLQDVLAIFDRLGFTVKEGPDVETEYYNFEALNIPDDHPARDMHDTFYLKRGQLLRTHTSPVQIRIMEKQAPPVKIVVPGNVYRCDMDITHSPMFHQVEGLYVDEHVTFAQLKGTLVHFLHEFFGEDRNVRFRPSYFPFTEPSAEVDVECGNCRGSGCPSCKYSGWLEILGAGMVNRNVFRSAGYDPDQVAGFAFGIGIERLAMLKYKVTDIRLFYENDVRFLSQF
ncbi:phenylalanine--tRNA ligase subunit alpha [bacterium]|nr:phenylalanine--tRNA ligase subunit alpha [bacterium]